MKIKQWPARERPREKLLQRGAESLSDAELLAVLLQVGTRKLTAVDLAKTCLQRFGSLHQFLQADLQTFSSINGLGNAKFALLQAAMEISRRQVYETIATRDVLQSPDQVKHYLSMHMTGLDHEVFAALFLDNRHRILEYRQLFNGTIDNAVVYPREIVKRCLYSRAAAVIFAHNHPSGLPEPSTADISLTHKLIETLTLIDVRVLDHVVIGQGECVSMAERGLM